MSLVSCIDSSRHVLWCSTFVVLVVTGSTDGIGKAFSQELASRGMDVLVISIGEDDCKHACTFLGEVFSLTACTTGIWNDLCCKQNVLCAFRPASESEICSTVLTSSLQGLIRLLLGFWNNLLLSLILIPTITNIVNLSLTSGQFHPILKESVQPLSHNQIIKYVVKRRLSDIASFTLLPLVFSVLINLHCVWSIWVNFQHSCL